MGKSYKIILSCVCIAFVFTTLGFGIGKMTDTAPAANGSQNINVSNTGSETKDGSLKDNVDNTGNKTRDSSPNINFDDTEIEGDGVEVRLQDGSVWTIIADQSVLGDDFDWENYDIWITDGHE